jgi:signal transduction histidine kinase
MKPFSTLTNRIFVASAALAVVSIGVAISIVNVRVTREAERELQRGLEEAGRLVDQHHEMRVESALRMARLVADLPKLKAVVDLADPPTVEPLARDAQDQVGSALLMVVDRTGRVLARVGNVDAAEGDPARLPGIPEALAGRETTAFWPGAKGMVEVVTVPILIGRPSAEILGALSVGFAFDDRLAGRFKDLTESEIAFALDGRIQAGTVPAARFRQLESLLGVAGTSRTFLGDEEYLALARPLASSGSARTGAADADRRPTALILRSRTKLLSFIGPLHTALAGTALVAVALATLLSYAVARTVTRPLRAITAAMREMAATGDLTRGARVPPPGRWPDEDTRLLASSFRGMTEALDRFQHEAGRRERLTALGRLSTVIAHEIRNPLMIIKTAIRTLRQDRLAESERREALRDIDGEVVRLNHLVDDVLDFARPIQFELSTVDVNEVCQAAASSAMTGIARFKVRLVLDASLPRVVTDRERLRGALVNLLTNSRHALEARDPASAPPADGEPDLQLITEATGHERVLITIRDRGVGIPAENMPRVWDPYFTTRRGGTGLGLAIVKNVVEALGGTIVIDSRPGSGTDIRVELPHRPPASEPPARAEGVA